MLRTNAHTHATAAAVTRTSADDDYLNVLPPTTTDYGCGVPRPPPGVGAGHRVGIQNLPAGGLTPLTAHL